MYEFRYDYVKPKYGEKSKLCYMDADTVYIKIDDFHKDIGGDVEARFGTSNYELNGPVPKGKNKKVISEMKDYIKSSLIVVP